MAKKIFDISPPESSAAFQKGKPLISERKVVPPLFLRKTPGPKRKALWGLVLSVLIIAAISVHFTLSRAEIEIWPETELETFEVKLTVDKKAENIDLISNLIPGISFEEEKTFSQEFPSTGKKLIEKPAEGVIRVYNEYHLPQTLVRYSRFQPSSEKVLYFCTAERLVVPSKSERDIKVFACSQGGRYAPAPGEEYNIKPSTFAVPGLAGTPQYTFVYGKSFEPMKGGLKKEVPEVKEEDLKEAERILKEKAAKEMIDILKEKIPPEFIVLEKAVEAEILETFSPARAGAELEKFTFQIKTKAVTLSFKKENLENFSKEFIISKIPTDKKVDQKSLKIEYLPEAVNLEAGEIVLFLNLEAKNYSGIDEVSLKQALSGKSSTETQFFLENQSEINRAKVRFFPFWVKQVPRELEKIKLKITID